MNLHRDLIEACKNGDRKSQLEIYTLYFKAMFNASLRIVNNTHEAEDIMQEAFLKAFSRLNQYKAEVSFGVWLKKKLMLLQKLETLNSLSTNNLIIRD